MLISRHWAQAFINSIENERGDVEDGIEALKALASWANKLPGDVFGSSAAVKAESLIREAMAKTANLYPAMETALRFFILAVRKNKAHHLDSIIEEAKKILDKKRGIVAASLEYAFPLGEDAASVAGAKFADASSAAASFADEAGIKEAIKKRTGAARVELSWEPRPELIGGYRLRIGDEIIDASVRQQLRKLEERLAAGISRDGGN